MDTPSPFALAAMLLSAPGWAKVGLTAPSLNLREQAALELATTIVARSGNADGDCSRGADGIAVVGGSPMSV